MAGNTVDIRVRAIGDFGDVLSNVKSLRGALQNIKMPDKLSNSLQKNINDTIVSIEKLQQKSQQGFKKPADVSAFEKELNKADISINKIVSDLGKLSGEELIKLNIDTTKINELKNKITEVKKEMASNVKGAMLNPTTGLKDSFAGIDQIINKGTKAKDIYNQFLNAVNKGNFSNAKQAFDDLQNHMARFGKGKINSEQWKTFETAVKAALGAAGIEVDKLAPKLNKLDRDIEEVTNIESSKFVSGINQMKSGVQDTANGFSALADRERQAANEMLSMSQQMSQLKTQANYFFGLQNMFQLLKRGIRDAVDTIKELDASMTQTAVVTDFSVSDMWNMLPEYTKAANELGSTINDVYQAATLYYQQGLEQNQAMGLATETLKMARIGGLGATEATDMMTAALRGFNMEIDELSGKRINDVYSNLAAKTASDTRELGEAMERTASIAHSANMEFETTAAFLANMIETTREAPENLGTAMKTIVARFQEMKENPYSISEVEGEEVDFNRVDKALKTIGVKLTESRDKFRDLDDVFLEISEKWDTLTQTQQRYIATIAAGSRQQSRFIAMVANYKRTMELVGYANESAGASNVQFEKTLDSMAAKANRFKTAWQQFIMGITDNKLIKFAVDFGTSFLSVINKIINTISGGNGLIKSVLSLVAAFSGLKIAGKFINSMLGGLGKIVDPTTKGGFSAGMTGRKAEANATQAKLINQPIVSVLNKIFAAMPNKNGVSSSQNGLIKGLDKDIFKQNYQDIRKTLFNGSEQGKRLVNGKQKYVESYKYSDILPKMKGMDTAQQSYILNNNPSLKRNLKTDLFSMVTGGKTDLSAKDKLQYKGMVASLQKYAQTSGTGLEITDLLNAKSDKQAQQKIVQGLASSDSEIAKTYAQHIENARQKLAEQPYFKNASLEQQEKFLNKYATKQTQKDLGLNFDAVGGEKIITKTDKLAQSLGKVGGGAQGAGMALQGMGAALSSMGLETLGGVVSGLGSAFMSLGSVISGVGSVISTIGMGPMIAIAAGIGAIIAAVVIWKKHQQKIKDDAQEVADSYKKTSEETAENLSKLEDYKDEYARLAQGVDINGNNVDLGTEEYRDYLKITDEIAAMSPELVQGWNAEGHAILDRNNAVEEAIKLEQKRQKEANKKYTSDKSMEKTYEAMKLDDNYKLNKEQVRTTTPMAPAYGVMIANSSDSDIKAQAKKIAYEIKEAGGDQILIDFGIDPDAIDNLTDQETRMIEQHGAEINSRVQSDLTDIDEAQLEEINDSIAEYGNLWDDYRESYAELLNQMQVKASDLGYFENIQEEMRPLLNQAIETVVADADIDLKDKWQAIEDFHKKLVTLDFNDVKGLEDFEEKYSSALKEIQTAQDQFEEGLLDSDGYQKATEKWIDQLNSWATAAEQKWEATGDTQYQLLYEMLTNMSATTASFDKSMTFPTLEESLNSLSEEFASAAGAYEAFTKSIEGGDYYTAAEGLGKIFEEINDKNDASGAGSKTYWKGMKELLSEKEYEKFYNNRWEGGSEQAYNRAKQIQNYFKEGVEGYNNWMDHLKGLDFKKLGIDQYISKDKNGEIQFTMDDISSEEFHKIAEALQLSDDAFAALLDKAQQYQEIDFTNPEQFKQALENDENVKKTDDGRYIIREDYLETAEEASGQQVKDETLKEVNATVLKPFADYVGNASADTFSKASEKSQKEITKGTEQWMSDVGIKGKTTSMEGLVTETMSAGLGQEDAREAFNMLLAEGKITDKEANVDLFNDTWMAALAAQENPLESNIDSNVTQIADQVSTIAKYMAIDRGVLAEGQEGSGKQAWEKLVGPNKGADTFEQFFAKGTDENGKALTGEAYADAKKKITAEYDRAVREKEILERQLESAKAHGNDAEETRIQKELDSWTDVCDKLEEYKDKGIEIHDDRERDLKLKMADETERKGNFELSDNQKNIILNTQLKTTDDVTEFLNTMKGDKEEIFKIAAELDAGANVEDFIKNYKGDLSEEQIRKIKFIVDNKDANAEIEGTKEKAEDASQDREATITANDKKADNTLTQTAALAVQAATNRSFSIVAHDNATDTLNAVNRKKIEDKHVSIWAKVKGLTQKLKEFFGIGAAGGLNNYIPHQTLPTIGSLAKGTKGASRKSSRYGMVGPTGKGGLTLTGERGFEIAWLPSEGRSMILGAKGPQMVNLPSDAVVWTNQQSKKIIKQKAIPAGSHDKTAKSTGRRNLWQADGSSGSSGSSSGNSGNTTKTKTIKSSSSSDSNTKKRTIELIKQGKLSVYVYNMSKKIEQIERRIAKWQDVVNKKLQKASTTLQNMVSSGNKYISNLKKEKNLNQQLVNYYTKKLKKLNKKGRTSIEWTNDTREEEKKGSGKWKKKSTGSKKHKTKVNLGKYIKYDKSTGAYIIDQSAINKVAKKDKNKAKAIRDKAKEKIDEYTSGRNEAKDKIKDAQDKLDELAKQLYDTFFGWENELTKVFNLTQKVTALEERRAQADKKRSLESSLISSGIRQASQHFIQQSLATYRNQLKIELNEIKKRNELIAAQQQQLNNLLTTKDEKAQKDRIAKNLQLSDKQDKIQSKINKNQSKVNKYNANRKKAKSLKKDVLSSKTRKKYEDDVAKLEKKKKKGTITKAEKKRLKEEKAKLAADKKARKFRKKNSTKKLTKKNFDAAKEQVKDQKKLENKKRQAELVIKNLNKKKKLSKAQKQELADAKKQLKAAKAGLAKNAKAQKLINAYNAKRNVSNLKDDLAKVKKRLKNANLKHLSATERAALDEERKQLEEQIKNTKTAQKYIKTTKNADGTVNIDIDYAKLEKDKAAGLISKDLYDFIKQYYDDIENMNSELMESYNAQMDLIQEMSDRLSQFKQEYAERADELLSAYEEMQQSQIDRLDKLNNALTNALKALLDEVKKRLDQRRQQEDNAKTEEDITKKQQRLAALRADSSGSNAKEIKQLEKEIADAQQSYTRTLEDQTLQRMQDQADEASEQRQKQIDLLSAQLEYQKQTGVLAAQINEWLSDPDKYKDVIESVYMSNKDMIAQTAARQDVIKDEFQKYLYDVSVLPTHIKDTDTEITNALQEADSMLNDINISILTAAGKYVAAAKAGASGKTIQQASGKSAQQTQQVINKAGANQSEMAGVKVKSGVKGKRTWTDSKGKTHTKTVTATNGTINATGTRVAAAKDDKVYLQKWDPKTGKVTGDITGTFDINTIDPVKRADVIKNNKSEFKEAFKYAVTHQAVGSKINANTKDLVKALGVAGKEYKLANGIYGSISGTTGNIHYNNGTNGVKIWKTSKGQIGNAPFSKAKDSWFYKNRQDADVKREYTQVNDARKKKKLSHYKTGGLATSTGPAWLDGTPSKPELVLNAQDTKNFLALKDTLSKAVSNSGSVTNDTNMTYDIDINVDHIASDYDVDQIANRIQKKIVQSANYRNVNAVRNIR